MDNFNTLSDDEPPPKTEELNSEIVPFVTVSSEKPFINSEIPNSDFNTVSPATQEFRAKHFPQNSINFRK